jgi:hypothetical protein
MASGGVIGRVITDKTSEESYGQMLGFLNACCILVLVNDVRHTARNKGKKCLFFIDIILGPLFIKELSLFEYAVDKSLKRTTSNGWRR